ncbi:MAG TPA: 6-phosphogluconolactonase [Gemmatimonadales bacterium]|jgi:6-phosphogluconolactonase|nr:6-phosphogluconolactonase [Gemmatimonadales bacterium]
MARDLAQVVVAPAERWVEEAAARIAGGLEASVVARGWASIALAGGGSPRPVYQRLAAMTLPWNRIDVFFGDERAVPPEHRDSNYHMAAETLLDPAGVPLARRHRMPADAADRVSAAAEYAELLPERLDLLLLGVGRDGHTASLFPGSRAVKENWYHVVPSESPEPPTLRLTITPPVIAAARARLVLARGPDKAAAVARALEGDDDPEHCPAQLARAGVWLLDEAAAAGLVGTAA